MTGIFLLAVIALWIWACKAMALDFTRKIQSLRRRGWTALAVFLVLLPLPVADEIVGGVQFRSLCKKNAVVTIDANAARGRTVRIEVRPSNESVPWQVLHTLHSHFSFRDVNTGEVVARYDRYVVKGGWLINLLGISEGNAPLLIGHPYCSPSDRAVLDKKYNFKIINR